MRIYRHADLSPCGFIAKRVYRHAGLSPSGFTTMRIYRQKIASAIFEAA